MTTEKSKRKLNTQSFFAGGFSGLFSTIVLQPMDVIKTRLQQNQNHTSFRGGLWNTFKYVLRTDGFLGLWRGTMPSIYRNVPGSACYFGSLEVIRTLLATVFPPGSGSRYHPMQNIIAGGLARGTVGFILLPITVIKARFESNLYKYGSVPQAFKSIAQNEGLRGLFSGLAPTVLRDVPYASIQVSLYEHNRIFLSRISTLSFSSVNFLSSLAAGMMATLITQPADTLKTKMQIHTSLYRNTLQSTLMIIKNEGITALWKGSTPRLLRKSASSAISWSVYEEILRTFQFRKPSL